METTPALPDRCPSCGRSLLAVLYYGADGEPVGGHRVCTECGSRTSHELPLPSAELQLELLERKAS